MKRAWLITILMLGACQSTSEEIQTFEDLLKITDTTDRQICSLPLTKLRDHLSSNELETAKAKAFDIENIIMETANDPIAQIRILFRRSALRRRLNVDENTSELAKEFYESFDIQELPTTLKGFHDEFHFWMDRISEQKEYGTQDSAAYNIRFCVMNERRADLHSASRKDILARVKKGVKLPAPELIENVNHETSFNDGFASGTLAEIFTKENSEGLTPLDRAKMRSDESILPFDPSTADLFWQTRDEEISAFIEYIHSYSFSTPADKLKYMTDIDQSLRKLWGGNKAVEHFENTQEFEHFKKGISERVIKVDEFNTAELKNMLSDRGWFRDDLDGKGAAHNAWLIAQHADRSPDFQIRALELIEADLDAPGVSKANYAYLYDRVQMRFQEGNNSAERTQKFGTQGRCTGPGIWEPFPMESPEDIDQLRAEMGLGSMTQYKSRFKDICKEDQR